MNTLPRIAVFAYAATIALGVLAGPATANPEDFMATAPGAEETAAGSDYQAGQAAVEGGDYQGAVEHLMKAVAAEPDNADAYNLLGYTHRKLQNFPAAFASYERALEIDPDHARAHQYIGEAYLETDNLEMAEQHLRALDLICLFGCEDFDDLKEAVELYRANNTS